MMLEIMSMILQTAFWAFISWEDIRTREIPVWPELLFGAVGVVAALGLGMSVWEILGGVALGAGSVALAYVSREALGYGDALCVGVIGIWNGISSMVWILMCAMFLLLITAMPLLLLKKATRKTKLPMAPFLMAGILLVQVPAVWAAL